MDGTTARDEAIRILYRREQGLAEDAEVDVPADALARLGQVVDANVLKLESQAARLIIKATSEQRRKPRRHQLFALGLLVVIGILILIGALILNFLPIRSYVPLPTRVEVGRDQEGAP